MTSSPSSAGTALRPSPSGAWTSANADGTPAECEIQLVADGTPVGPIVELGTDDVANHNASDRGLGWSLTGVSPILDAGSRTIQVQVREPVGDCDLRDISTSAVVLGTA